MSQCEHPTESCYLCGVCEKDAGCLMCDMEWHDTVTCTDLKELRPATAPLPFDETEEAPDWDEDVSIEEQGEPEAVPSKADWKWLDYQKGFVLRSDLEAHGFNTVSFEDPQILSGKEWYKKDYVLDTLNNP